MNLKIILVRNTNDIINNNLNVEKNIMFNKRLQEFKIKKEQYDNYLKQINTLNDINKKIKKIMNIF